MRTVTVFLLALCAKACLAQRGPCSQAMVAGTYAVSVQGTLILPGPIPAPMASLGTATIDLTGAASISGYQSIGGEVSQFQLTGTITVQSNCTASANFGGDITENLVVQDAGAVLKSLTLTDGASGIPVTQGEWKRISPRDEHSADCRQCGSNMEGEGPRREDDFRSATNPVWCAPEIPIGNYAYRSSATVVLAEPPGPVPVTSLGIATFGLGGTDSLTATTSIGGQVLPLAAAPTAPVVVSPNCTAIVTLNVTSQGVPVGQHQDFLVVLGGGTEIWDLTIKDFLGQSTEFGTMTRL